MEKVIDLKDLLKHEIMDLYSAEEQIIEALPLMIEKAGNDKLKTALKHHLKVTKNQKSRLDEIKKLLGEPAQGENGGDNQKPGFSSLFGGGAGKCKGMEGLISEGKKMMSADMSPQASDASIIASAQKIEHYEICGYGTARAFARELNLGEVANKLEQTLNEEYAADDLLTELAVGKINVEAEFADGSENGSGASKPSQTRSDSKSKGGSISAKNKKTTAKSNGSSSGKSNSSKSPSKSSASKTSSSTADKSKAAGKKSTAKSSKSGSNKPPSKSKLLRRR